MRKDFTAIGAGALTVLVREGSERCALAKFLGKIGMQSKKPPQGKIPSDSFSKAPDFGKKQRNRTMIILKMGNFDISKKTPKCRAILYLTPRRHPNPREYRH